MADSNLILILGVTASGKENLGFELAKCLGGQIVSVDSMKVYKRMDIGTAKPSLRHRREVQYHLIDIAQPSDSFSVDRFLESAGQAITQIRGQDKPVIAVGGTAMYIKALLFGLFEGPAADKAIRQRLKAQADSEGLAALHARLAAVDHAAAQRIHPNDQKRIIRALEVFELTGTPISSLQKQFDAPRPLADWTIIGLRREKTIESRRINMRVKKMIELGLVDEVRSLLAEEKPLSPQAGCAIGYAEIIEHLQGRLSLEDAIEKIKTNTRKLAKAQRTWFKTFRQVNWLDVAQDGPDEEIISAAMRIIGR